MFITDRQEMADQNLRDLITDFQNLAESEHHGFIENIVSRTENAVTIFASLSLFEVGCCLKIDAMQSICLSSSILYPVWINIFMF